MKIRISYKTLKLDPAGKEPSLYTVQILTAVWAVAFGILLYLRARADVISGCLLSYLAAVVIQQCYAAFRQSRTNPYSYNIIYYRGFFLFFLVLLGMTIQYCKGIFQVPEAFTALDLIWYLTDSTVTYLFCSIPAVVAFSVWLCVSNICLIRHEGKRLVNVLGILLAFSMTGTLLLLVYFGALHPNWVTGKYRFVLNLVMNLCSVFYLYLQCMLIGSFLAVFSVAYCEPDTDRDYIIVLGCGIRKDGTPTPLLRGRIDRAIAFYEKQKKTTGQMPGFVTSGGQGADECISECASMKAYLLEHGIPKEQIIEEDQSENTYQNMLYSAKKIKAAKPDAKIAFSTTNYHVFRSGLYARRVGLCAVGMGQPTKWWFWPNATVREFVGLLTEDKKKQAAILGSFVAICVTMTVLSFRY